MAADGARVVREGLGETMSSYWAHLAADGDPNGAGLPNWAPYAGEIQPQELGDTVKPFVIDVAKSTFWKSYCANLLGL